MKELREAAANAELILFKDTNAAWVSAGKYCECTRKILDISENADEVTADTDWDSYLDAMWVLSDIKDFVQRTVIIARDKYKWD